MSSHTPEPWNVGGMPRGIRDAEGYGIAHFYAYPNDAGDVAEAEANAERTVACVNAFAGVENPAAELARLRERVGELEKTCADVLDDIINDWDTEEARQDTKDRLAAALNGNVNANARDAALNAAAREVADANIKLDDLVGADVLTDAVIDPIFNECEATLAAYRQIKGAH
jgi:hypothetical protein